ncbi:hypothetical protein D3C72_1002160 [compost metagenome]
MLKTFDRFVKQFPVLLIRIVFNLQALFLQHSSTAIFGFCSYEQLLFTIYMRFYGLEDYFAIFNQIDQFSFSHQLIMLIGITDAGSRGLLGQLYFFTLPFHLGYVFGIVEGHFQFFALFIDSSAVYDFIDYYWLRLRNDLVIITIITGA